MQKISSLYEPRIAYLGDDFTGSTDALECLSLAGLRARLFLEPPTCEQLAALPQLDAIGVAGRARSLPVEDAAREAREALMRLRELNPRHVHYKVCSTCDSSPTVGSIGRVIDEAWEIFRPPFVPVVVCAPPLGRWCVFGNLFAQQAIGHEGEVFRLDRHPTMRNHPSTPADESDLRVHLARQTDKSIVLFDIRQVDLPIDQVAAEFRKLLERRPDIVLFDVLHAGHLAKIGTLLDSYAQIHAPLFCVGSSGVEMALTAHWEGSAQLPRRLEWEKPARREPIVVISGSCSPVTSAQIECALSSGFAAVPIETIRLFRNGMKSVLRAALSHLNAGRSVIVHTAGWPDELRHVVDATSQCISTQVLGTVLGRVLAACVSECGIKRACIVGGDTASYAARAVGIDSLEMIAPLVRGAPLCRVKSHRHVVDGLEAVFKAGQLGGPDFFVKLAEGAA